MAKIVSVNQIGHLCSNLHKSEKKIVLVGGCFDVLHPGHVIFLQKARQAGDILIVLLESDQKISLLKGPSRPVHDQKMRAKVLSALEAVTYVVLLPFISTEAGYDEIIREVRPDIIALTKGYGDDAYHKRAAALTGAKIKYVAKIPDHSTSRILNRGVKAAR